MSMDSGFVFAIERNCNEADADMVRGYGHTYAMACFLGDEQWMNRVRRQLVREMIKAEHRGVTPVTDMARGLV